MQNLTRLVHLIKEITSEEPKVKVHVHPIINHVSSGTLITQTAVVKELRWNPGFIHAAVDNITCTCCRSVQQIHAPHNHSHKWKSNVSIINMPHLILHYCVIIYRWYKLDLCSRFAFRSMYLGFHLIVFTVWLLLNIAVPYIRPCLSIVPFGLTFSVINQLHEAIVFKSNNPRTKAKLPVMKALWSIQEMTDRIEKLNLEFGTMMENGPSRLRQQFPHLIMETHESPHTAAAFFPSCSDC